MSTVRFKKIEPDFSAVGLGRDQGRFVLAPRVEKKSRTRLNHTGQGIFFKDGQSPFQLPVQVGCPRIQDIIVQGDGNTPIFPGLQLFPGPIRDSGS